MKLFSSILLFLLFLQNQPTITNSSLEGKLHTTISYIDLTIKYNDGEDLYQDNVTVFDISTNVEVWNTGSESQSIGYNWYNPMCGYFLNVGANITDEVGIYEGDPLYFTQCGMTEKYFDPGITTANALIRVVFTISELVKLPKGEYIITAPTNNGIAYQTRLYTNDGVLEYQSEDLPINWGEVGILETTDTQKGLLTISEIGLFLSFVTIFVLRNLHKKRAVK